MPSLPLFPSFSKVSQDPSLDSLGISHPRFALALLGGEHLLYCRAARADLAGLLAAHVGELAVLHDEGARYRLFLVRRVYLRVLDNLVCLH